jgi:hypothetical protein
MGSYCAQGQALRDAQWKALEAWVLAGASEKAVAEALKNAMATRFAEHQAICPVCNRVGK